MKAHTLTFPLATALLALGAGCSSYSEDPYDRNQTARGATAGAVTGAVLGGVVGANSDKVTTEQGAAIGAAAGGLAGAAIGHRRDQREAAAAGTSTSAPVYSSSDTGFTVQQIPPAPVSEPQETVPPQPSPNAVWIRGHYTYTGTGYRWQPGRWEIPPAGTTRYIGPAWQPSANGGYVYVRGHWQ